MSAERWKARIRTRSRMKMWYLASFRGMQLYTVRREPRFSAMGVTVYRNRWTLVPQAELPGLDVAAAA